MGDDNGAQLQPDVVEQVSGMLTEEQPTTVTSTPQGAVPQGASPEEVTTSALPIDVTERTRKEFEKLRDDLRTEREQRVKLESMFQSIQKAQEPKTETPVGEADNTRILEAERKAYEVEAEFKRYLEEQENREVYTAYPQLNPEDESSFDKGLHVETRRILLDSMLNPDDYEGKQLSFKDAARLATDSLAGKGGNAEQIQKEQVSAVASGNAGRQQVISDDQDTLRYQTRRGDIDSIVSRLRNVPSEA